MRPYGWVVVAGLLSGCSTVAETFSDPPRCPGRLAYCGTQVDALLISAATDQDAGVLRALWPIALIDLPFSLVADTLILPYTLYRDATAEQRP
ncbi:MAG: YceK/YidQ family lipoprotein [Pseudomonas sp.]|uniref:YceK/YidQ family lipoprotein n=1 Tax=Pseudomonas sp. TaxID=306 RepID=UPI003398CF15